MFIGVKGSVLTGPDNWSPCGCECCNEETCKDNHGVANALRLCAITVVKREVTQRREDEEAHEHPQRTIDECRTTTILLYNVQAWKCAAEIYSPKNNTRDVGV